MTLDNSIIQRVNAIEGEIEALKAQKQELLAREQAAEKQTAQLLNLWKQGYTPEDAEKLLAKDLG